MEKIGWAGGTITTYAWQMTPFISFIGQKTLQSPALDVYLGPIAQPFYAQSFSTAQSTEDGQPGHLGQDVTGFAAVVIKNSDAIVLIRRQRTMASLVMEKILTGGFVIFRDAQNHLFGQTTLCLSIFVTLPTITTAYVSTSEKLV